MRILPALSQRADVRLWTVSQARGSASASVEALSKLADIRTFDPDRVPWEELNRADACIYNIGNNPVFHGAIWQVARRHAGIVILHDTRLHNFFDGLYRVQWRDLAGYLEVLNFYYGEEGLRDGADCYRNEARNIKESLTCRYHSQRWAGRIAHTLRRERRRPSPAPTTLHIV